MEFISLALMAVIGAAGGFLGFFALTNLNQDPLANNRSNQKQPNGAQQELKHS